MLHPIPRQKAQFNWRYFLYFSKLFLKGKLSSGNNIRTFEANFSKYIGVKHSIPVSSGRIGLYLILKCLKLKKGSEILLPAYTYHVLPEIIISLGLTPVFVDSDVASFNMSLDSLKAKISRKSKVIIATHLFGLPENMIRIKEIAKEHKLFVIEDCAQALGAEYNDTRLGSLGDAAYFSFETSKLINCFGGGMIVTDDKNLEKTIRKEVKKMPKLSTFSTFRLLFYGFKSYLLTSKILFMLLTYPLIFFFRIRTKDILDIEHVKESRLITNKSLIKNYSFQFTNLQALIGLHQMENLDNKINEILTLSKIYTKLLPSKIQPVLTKGARPVYLFFTVKVKERRRLIKSLLFSGIDVRDKYMRVCPNIPFYAKFQKMMPNALVLENSILHLPLYQDLKKKNIELICKKLK